MSIPYLELRASQHCVSDAANMLLGDQRFGMWSGSSKPTQHHYGDGGLLKHTTEVVKLAHEVNVVFDYDIDETDLFLACLFHDAGKMWDYAPTSQHKDALDYQPWVSTAHKRTIHHISRSAIYFNQVASNYLIPQGFDESRIDGITHAILAHHGQREWGSPVAPKTKLAWMLHLCDGISARMDDCDKYDPYSTAGK
jgi:3'-5' exoribonuclease